MSKKIKIQVEIDFNNIEFLKNLISGFEKTYHIQMRSDGTTYDNYYILCLAEMNAQLICYHEGKREAIAIDIDEIKEIYE